MAGGFRFGPGAPLRRSQRRTRPAPSAALPPPALTPGDRVRWPYHAGEIVRLHDDGTAEIRRATDGRRWRLPVAELRRC